MLNRLDEILIFENLTTEDIREIVRLQLAEVVARAKLLGMKLDYTDSLVAKIAEDGWSKLYGAREIRRIITQNIENLVSDELLRCRCDCLTLDVKNGEYCAVQAVAAAALPDLSAQETEI